MVACVEVRTACESLSLHHVVPQGLYSELGVGLAGKHL